jgi:hypothetical protein
MEACFSHKTTSTGKGFVALDDFRFRHRMPSRAATIRKILRAGLGVVESLPVGAHILPTLGWCTAARCATGRPLRLLTVRDVHCAAPALSGCFHCALRHRVPPRVTTRPKHDAVLGTVRGDALEKSLRILKPNSTIVSLIGPPDAPFARALGMNFLMVSVRVPERQTAKSRRAFVKTAILGLGAALDGLGSWARCEQRHRCRRRRTSYAPSRIRAAQAVIRSISARRPRPFERRQLGTSACYPLRHARSARWRDRDAGGGQGRAGADPDAAGQSQRR